MTAKLVISFDFELGWGVLDSPVWRIRQDDGVYTRLRPVLSDLIALLESSQLPTTWAMVSSLVTERERDLDLDHLSKPYRDSVVKFFRESSPETRCAVDLIEKWSRISSFSEVCSHTSTHVYPEYPSVTSDQYVADVKQSLLILEKTFSTPVKSLIFPRDDILFRHEITAKIRPLNFRLNPSFYNSHNKLGRVFDGAMRFVRDLPASVITSGACGEVYQSGSMYFNWSGGDFEQIKKKLVDIQSKRLIGQLERTDNVYHVWIHPFNLAESVEHYLSFSLFLKKVVDLRDMGVLDVVTMADIGTYTNTFNGVS